MTVRAIADLTPRQRQIAALIGRGFSYAEIAEKLPAGDNGRKPSAITVRNHVVTMALRIDIDDDNGLTPREKVLLFVRFEEWAKHHRPTR